MSGLVSTLFIFVTLMVMSYIFVRSGMLSKSFAKDASSLTLNVLICATIINSVISNPPTLSTFETFRALGLVFLLYAMFYVVATLLCRFIAPDRNYSAVVMLLMAVNNNIFIGVPVAEQLFGPQAVLYVTMGSLPFYIILYSYGVWCLLKSGENARKVRLRDMFSSPLIATAIALLIYLTKTELPPVLVRLISVLSSATLPMSMFVIGAVLSSVSLLDAFKNFRFYIIAAVRLLLLPILTWLIFRFFSTDPVFIGACVIAAACPTGIVVTALSIQFDKDAVFPAECILMCTILSMITIPVITGILL